MPPKKVKLKSPQGHDHTTFLGFNVGQNGLIANAPTKFQVFPGDNIIWAIGNTSGQPITVTLMDFFRKTSDGDDKGDPNDPVMPFNWLVSNILQLEDKQQGFIVAARDPAYRVRGFFHDALSYTIRVESRAPSNPFDSIDYDPDGDIKP